MTGLGLETRLAIAAAALGTAAFGLGYYRRQNRAGVRLGGAISRAKALWLAYAVFFWFFLCPLLALSPAVPAPQRALLGAFAAFMWLRGLAEAALLFVWKRWTPPMGIAHDLACLALLAAGAARAGPALWQVEAPSQAWGLGLLGALVLSLVLEVGYAWSFYRVVGQRTRGEDALWFASEEDPRFRTINRVTAAMNVPQYAFLLAFLGVTLHGA